MREKTRENSLNYNKIHDKVPQILKKINRLKFEKPKFYFI